MRTRSINVVRPLMGKRNFVIHYHGEWGKLIAGKVKVGDYKGGLRKDMELDGDELCLIDLTKDCKNLLGEGFSSKFRLSCIVKRNEVEIASDQNLLDVWAEMKPEGDKKYHIFISKMSSIQPTRIIPQTCTMPFICSTSIQSSPRRSPRFANVNTSRSTSTTIYNPSSKRSIFPDISSEVALFENEAFMDEFISLDGVDGVDADISEDDEAERHECPTDLGPIVEQDTNYVPNYSSDEDDEFNPQNENNGCFSDSEEEELNDDVDEDNVFEDSEVKEDDVTLDLFKDEDDLRIVDPDPITTAYELVEGMVWPTMEKARNFLKTYAIVKKFTYKQMKNDHTRLRLRCKDPKCNWLLFASLCKDKHSVKLRWVSGTHTCAVDVSNRNSQLKAPWIIQNMEKVLIDNPDYTPAQIQGAVFSEFGVEPSYWTSWVAKCKQLELINGSYELSYLKVYELSRQIKKANPDTNPRWFRDEATGQFTGFFLAFDALISGFVQGCRPVIGLDGCFLKGKYGGYVLSACGLDAQNCLFPLAIFICNHEDTDNWSMMCALLQEYLNQHPVNLTFISDRQKGLIKAIQTYFPKANHR